MGAIAALVLLGANALSRVAGRWPWAPLSQTVLDASVTIAVVWAFTFDQHAALWALLSLPMMEAALRWGVTGALVSGALLAPAYTAVQMWAAAAYERELMAVSVTYRLGLLLLLASVAGVLTEHLRRQALQLAAAFGEARHRGRLLETVAEAGRRLPGLDVPTLLQEVAAAASALGFVAAELALVDTAHQRYLVAARRGLPADAGRHPVGEGLVGQVLRADAPVRVDDYSAWPHAVQTLRHEGIGLAIGVPVRVGGEVRAVLCGGMRRGEPRGSHLEEALELLAQQVGAALEVARRTALLDRHARDMEYQALHDALTGLPNRVALLRELERRLTASEREPFHLLYLDLDGFKAINDRLGHRAGDELLRVAAGRLSRTVRAPDMVARLGGDEFVVLVGDSERLPLALLAERVSTVLSDPVALQSETLQLRVSVGGASCVDGRPATAERLLAEADAAMYTVKAARHSDPWPPSLSGPPARA